MSKNTIKMTLGLLAVGCMLAMAAPAGAESLPTSDSTTVDWWKYEMDVKPDAEDLDANSVFDFTEDYKYNGTAERVNGFETTAVRN